MKHLILTFIASLLILCLHAQKWQHIIGYPGTLEEGRELIEHYDHGYLVTSSRSAGSGDHRGWLVKTDINGNKLWDIELGMNPDVVFIDKTLYDENGNIYIFGLIVQDTEYDWPLVVKLNACGEKVWCKNLYNPDFYFGYFTDAMLLDNGDLLGLAYFPDEAQYDIIFLFCLSPDGEYKWKKSYASKANYPDFAQRMGNTIRKFGDTFIISGYVYSPYPGNPNHAYLRPMFIGIDEGFKEQWVVEFGINDSLLGKADGAIAINDTLFMGVGRHRFVEDGTEDQQSWLMFFDAKGNERGYKLLSDSQFGQEIKESVVFDIERIDEVKFMAAGGFMTVDEDISWAEMIIDTAGNVYDYAIRENSGGGGTYMVKTFDDKYTIASSHKTPNTNFDIMLYKINENLEQDTLYPGNYTYDSLCKGTIESGVIDLAGCDVVTSIGEIPTLEQYREKMQSIGITASPNPTSSGEVLLELENTESFTNMELHVTNVYGNQIHSESILPQQGAVRLDVSSWPAGIFVATVLSNGEVKGKAKFVVR